MKLLNHMDRKQTQSQNFKNITDTIIREYSPEKIILFGSQARGVATPQSDVDLVVIKKTSVPFLQRMRELARILVKARLGQGADVLVYTPEEFQMLSKRWNPFFHRLRQEGKIIYGR